MDIAPHISVFHLPGYRLDGEDKKHPLFSTPAINFLDLYTDRFFFDKIDVFALNTTLLIATLPIDG